MLQPLTNLKGLSLEALDGDLGRVEDFIFDREHWTVRYLVASTGTWLGRHVLVSPIYVGQPDWVDSRLEVRLTKDQIRNSPEVPAYGAFSREAEAEYAAYYGHAPYWGGANVWGWAVLPGALTGAPPPEYTAPKVGDIAGVAVHSLEAFRGLHLHTRDGQIGHVDDGIVDDESWRLRYLLVDTSNLIGGTHVLVPTMSIRAVDWIGRVLTLDLTTDQIRRAPQYDRTRPMDRIVEAALDRHYGQETQGRPAAARSAGSGR
jgi:hypothetical protein